MIKDYSAVLDIYLATPYQFHLTMCFLLLFLQPVFSCPRNYLRFQEIVLIHAYLSFPHNALTKKRKTNQYNFSIFPLLNFKIYEIKELFKRT